MCCGLICALAGTVAGVGAFFSTAAVSSWLFPATGAVASGAADVLIMSPLPQINPKLVPKILPEAISSIGQVSGAVLLVEHFLFLLIIGWWASSKILGLVRSGASSERVKQQQPPLAELCQMQALSDRIRALTGPASVFEWDDVKEAPPPSMDMDALADGQVRSGGWLTGITPSSGVQRSALQSHGPFHGMQRIAPVMQDSMRLPFRGNAPVLHGMARGAERLWAGLWTGWLLGLRCL